VKTVQHFTRIECWAGQFSEPPRNPEMNSGERKSSLLVAAFLPLE